MDNFDENEFGFPPDEVSYRKYEISEDLSNEEREKLEIIHKIYKSQRTNINYSFNIYLINKYCKYNSLVNFWSLFHTLDGIVDLSDPDTSLPNSVHALQTSESIRKDNKPDWYILCGLIHDMGKALYLTGKDEDGTSKATQWAIVGDTFITGCDIPDDIVLPEYNILNTDHNNIYTAGCGLSKCSVSFGHDEYLYRLLEGCSTLPLEALYIIRYHSLYAWHSGNSYDYLMDSVDIKMKPIVKEFSSYDLYTKSDKVIKWDGVLKDYYTKLVKKYISNDMMIRC